ncbi:DNA helicase [Martiniozyma asiatica (nom. inval.)]|nr:DNA helicase [Martiniozyma asiatica]
MVGLSRIGKKKNLDSKLAFSRPASSISRSNSTNSDHSSPSSPSTSTSTSSFTKRTSSIESILRKQSRLTGSIINKKSSKHIKSMLGSEIKQIEQTQTQQRRPAPWKIARKENLNPIIKRDENLSDEQHRVMESIIQQKKSIFFTGSAGTGKSYLLKKIIRKLHTRYGKEAIGISAPTGLAAANIGGETIHRLMGIGLGQEGLSDLALKIKKNQRKHLTWKKLQVLIIDEVSMVDGELFSKLNQLAKLLRENTKPFGGIQVVLCGDFLQLPPVSKGLKANYCFNSKAWDEVINESIILTKVFRQQGDQDLIKILNALRIGKIDATIEKKFQSLSRPLQSRNGIVPTELYPTREEVQRSNESRLDELDGVEFIYKFQDFAESSTPLTPFQSKALDTLMCSKELKLKVGAQVMHLKNDQKDSKLVNGTLGLVEGFFTPFMWTYFMNKYQDTVSQNINLLTDISNLAIVAHKQKKRILVPSQLLNGMNEFQQTNFQEICASFNPLDPMFPVVKFTTSDDTVLHRLMMPDDFRLESMPQFTRRQLPIILAWSMSIHKSQGQTLQLVKVDLQKVFEKGQVYVALSRCVDSKGLQVVNFDKRKVSASNEVIEFYDSLSA